MQLSSVLTLILTQKKRLFSVHNVFTIKSESEKIEHDVKYVLSIVI